MQILSKKVFTLYSLAMQQLSKQDHYDFGLRSLTSLLRYAGRKRRTVNNVPDEEVRPESFTWCHLGLLLYCCVAKQHVCLNSQVVLMAMKDMNIAKLTSIDLPLFNGIIQDLFPAVKTPEIDYSKVLHSPSET